MQLLSRNPVIELLERRYNMKKRFLGLFLAVLMAVSMLSLTACAEAGESSVAVTEPEISSYDK